MRRYAAVRGGGGWRCEPAGANGRVSPRRCHPSLEGGPDECPMPLEYAALCPAEINPRFQPARGCDTYK